MTRQQEFTALLEELQTTPPALAGTAKRAKARARRRRFGVSLGSLAAVAAAFVIVVNAMPTFALACGSVPILRELAAAVAFSPSLSEAVRHDYVQYVGKSQTVNGVTVTLETVIADQQQLIGFYRTDLPAETSATCNLLGEGIPAYSTTSSYSGDALRSFTVHLQDGALPEAFTLSLQLTASDETQERFEVEGSFDFDLHLDPEKTSASVSVAMGKEVTLDGQTLRVSKWSSPPPERCSISPPIPPIPPPWRRLPSTSPPPTARSTARWTATSRPWGRPTRRGSTPTTARVSSSWRIPRH